MSRIQTSKIILWIVILFGLVALPLGLFTSMEPLIAYGLILAASIYNRLDSRARGYKFSAECGPAKFGLEQEGDHDKPKK